MPRLNLLRFACFVLFVSGLFSTTAKAEERLRASHYKSGPATKRLFRDLITDSNKATVKFLKDDKPVALGAIVSEDGEVLTKASEIRESLKCELWDGTKADIKILATDKNSDLALVKIAAEKLSVITWDTTTIPGVGQWLVTPGQKELPVSVGIVSVANRNIPPDRGVLGISIEDLEVGPRITRIFPNSGAAKAGLKVGDIVTNVAGKEVKTGRSLSARIGSLRPGDSLKLFILREEKTLELQAVLGYPQSDMSRLLNRGSFQNRLGGELSLRRGGFTSIIQHDSVLAPEECGGPIVGLTGKAIGLNIARGGRTESYAIPAKTAIEVYKKLQAEHLASKATEESESPVSANEGESEE